MFCINNFFIDQLDGNSWIDACTDKFFGTSDPYSGKIINSRWANFQVPFMDSDFFESEGIDPNALFFETEYGKWENYLGQRYHITNGFGLLRSPWIQDADPSLKRFGNTNRLRSVADFEEVVVLSGSNCDNLLDYLDYAGDINDVLEQLESSVHGPIHRAFGGMGGDLHMEQVKKMKAVDEKGFTDNYIATLAYTTKHFIKVSYMFDSIFLQITYN